ncbi:MAG: phosphoribosyltransferase family protein [Candidatus Micrarchaeota archaeon]
MFRDRYDAGMRLSEALSHYKGRKDAIVLAIPRGALQIGEVLHKELGLPLDIIVTKKIPHPISEEYAIGAVGPGGECFLTEAAEGIETAHIERERKRLAGVVEEKYVRYRGKRAKPELAGKVVIIIDDGIATGSTMLAAIHVVRKQKPARIVVAVPVGPADTIKALEKEADEFVCLDTPSEFFAIGQFYQDFTQIEDEEAIAILKRCR